jgi:hypothetical protein
MQIDKLRQEIKGLVATLAIALSVNLLILKPAVIIMR